MTTATKPDNLFGVCAAIGDDLGFNPNYLRVALGAGILWNAAVVLAIYGMMAAVVLGTRVLFPDTAPAAWQPTTLPEPANTDAPELARAAGFSPVAAR